MHIKINSVTDIMLKPKLSIQQNYFWERMNNHFLKSYPRVKVIDMTEDFWIADFKHPLVLL